MIPEQNRSEVESRIHVAVEQNKEVEDARPKGISDGKWWREFNRRAQVSKIRVRQLPLEIEEGPGEKEILVYLVDMKRAGGIFSVIMKYAGKDSVEEFFQVELSDIIAVE